jgi:hypothetical protein
MKIPSQHGCLAFVILLVGMFFSLDRAAAEILFKADLGFLAYPLENVYSRALLGRGCRCGGRPAEVAIQLALERP